ncbi:MAG TPA: hypothetical protein VMB03_20250 [Bryobacteraceae bacterium]|nr:hypothetical protein [Bryobacteraceae bacterium]
MVGQPTGKVSSNQASVVFDANAPISTPTWTNTLDVDPPQSSVQALPAMESLNSVFQNTVTTTTSATFRGRIGHTDGFYSIAVDGAGT